MLYKSLNAKNLILHLPNIKLCLPYRYLFTIPYCVLFLVAKLLNNSSGFICSSMIVFYIGVTLLCFDGFEPNKISITENKTIHLTKMPYSVIYRQYLFVFTNYNIL